MNQKQSTPTRAAQAAAAWWTDKISGRVVHNNGDDSLNGAFATVAAGMLAARQPTPPDGQFEVFQNALAEIIQERLDRFADFDRVPALTLGCDYGPNPELAKAAQSAGIPTSRFPWKTNMWVRSDHVTVSAGYRGQTVLVWAAPDWDRPPCGSQRGEASEAADDYGWRYLPGKCGLPRYHEGEHGDWVASPLCAECGKPEDWPDHDAEYAASPRHHEFLGAS